MGMSLMEKNDVDSNLEKLFSMKGGKGEASYANNSQAQAIHAKSMIHFLRETLDQVKLGSDDDKAFAVADLGCSWGSNTIDVMNVIIDHINKRYEALGYNPPEFSAFFSDLPSNDFNSLFQLLPPIAEGATMEECLATGKERSYFVAGVPGSFYRRLFPARTVDVFHSTFSVHWLSKVN